MEGEYFEEKTVILDNGSDTVKLGLPNESDEPNFVIRNVIGIPYKKDKENSKNSIIVGFDIKNDDRYRNGEISLRSPIGEGAVENWDDMEKIWNYCFYEKLDCTPKDYKLVFTQSNLDSIEQRDKIIEIMFETYQFKELLLANHNYLSFYSSGSSTGVICDSGDEFSSFSTIIDCQIVPFSTEILKIGGRTITEYLKKILGIKTNNFDNFSLYDREIIRGIKEKECYVKSEYKIENEKNDTYKLPDGRVINLPIESKTATEILFHPELIGQDFGGFDKICVKSIENCQKSDWKHVAQNIVLSGGNSLFNGLKERLTLEIKNNEDYDDEVRYSCKVKALPNRKYAAWIGGKLLNDMTVSYVLFTSISEYYENGPEIVHKKYKKF